jgi:hypothetical protein
VFHTSRNHGLNSNSELPKRERLYEFANFNGLKIMQFEESIHPHTGGMSCRQEVGLNKLKIKLKAPERAITATSPLLRHVEVSLDGELSTLSSRPSNASSTRNRTDSVRH